jgi:hypothetical protein
MGDVMLYGVLRMPFDMAMGGEIARRQFYSRAQEAARRLEAAEARLAEIDAALASRPAEVDDKIPRESNDALIALAKYWKLDGDWMTCKGCRRSLIASRDGEELAHGDGCKYWDQQHPWAQMRKLIARRPAPSHTTNKEK